MSDRLQRALARFRRGRADDGGGTWARISAAEFRAATEERLGSLERERPPPARHFLAASA